LEHPKIVEVIKEAPIKPEIELILRKLKAISLDNPIPGACFGIAAGMT